MENKQLNKQELRSSKLNKKSFKKLNRNNIVIVLDSLKVAHNIGTIFRMSDAVLAKKVYLCGNTITPPNYKIRKSSVGAERWIDWEYTESIEDLIKELKSKNSLIISAEVSSNSIDFSKYNSFLNDNLGKSQDIVLIFGREYDGVSKEALELSDLTVHLPIYGMSNSLNVSTVASVLIYKTLEYINSN